MARTKTVSALVLLLAGGMITAEETLAQACLGNPAGPGRFALGGAIGFTDGATGYKASLLANLEGPLAVGASYTLTDVDDIDENVNSFGGTIAYELPLQGISACPATGLGYSRFSMDFGLGIEVEASSLSIPIGLGLGHTFTADGPLALTLYAVPQFLYMRTRSEASDGIDEFEETDTSSEFGAALGFTLGLRQVFFGAAVSLTTVEDSDPVFSIGVGLMFP